MEKLVCKCGKKIEGYTKDQVAYLMKQHWLARHAEDKEGIK